jgi:tetratricopeptide (TPR) repeat protein
MGQFYLDNADFENAQRHFEEALAFDPGRVQALVGLGRAERGLGDYAGAVRSFTSALASDEGLPLRGELADTYASWADDLAQRGEHADAAARYEYALRLRPDDLRCLKMLAALYRGPLGDAGKAIYLYRRALSSGGLSVAGAEELRKELAEAVREGRDIVDEYRLLVDRNPENATLRYNLGVFHHERNELDAAAEEYKRVIRLDPAHGYAHYNLGLIYQRKGMRSAALREFKLALHFRPGYHRAHYALGRFYEDLGAHAQAREEYARAIESAPGYAEAHLALGLLLRDRLRDEKAARDHLDRYRELKAAPESGEKGGSAASPAETAPRPSAGPS